MKYLFIITHGRSGSTLLQAALNAIPGYCIRGENGGALIPIQKTIARLSHLSGRFGVVSGPPDHPWYGIEGLSRQQMISDMRRFTLNNLIRPPADARVSGFKEINYGRDHCEDLPAHIAFMRELFPEARFVFNTRNAEDTAKSAWWPKTPGATEHLREFHERILAAHEAHHDVSLMMRYEEFSKDPHALASMYKWLGEPVDMDRIKTVLSKRISQGDIHKINQEPGP